jgi:hypothetical protein
MPTFNPPSEKFILKMLDAMNESLAIDGDFSYIIPVDNDAKWRAVIFEATRFEPFKYNDDKQELINLVIFNHHKLEIPVDKLEEYVRLAIANMSIYLEGMHLLRTQMAYFDPTMEERECYYRECRRKFRGPAVFCCHDHAYWGAQV